MAETSQHHAWVHPAKARYYQVYLDRDLFGEWTLRKVWGGIDSHRGQMNSTGVASYEDGIAQVGAIAERRVQRGYRSAPVP